MWPDLLMPHGLSPPIFSGVCTNEIVFEHGAGPAAHKLDAELLKRFEKVAQLSDRERDAVLVLLASVIAKQTLREVIQG